MAHTYTAPELEEIWSLLSDGFGPREIRRILSNAEGGLDYPLDVPEGTMKGILRRLRKQRGNPAETIKPGEERDSASASRRRLQAIMRKDAEKLEQIAQSRELKPSERKAIADLEERFYRIEARASEPAPSRRSAAIKQGNETRKDQDADILADIARRARADQ